MTASALIGPGQLTAAEVTIEGETFHHLFRVRRIGEGERIRLVDGQGGARWGEVAEVTRGRAVIKLAEPAPDGEAALELELWVAAPKKSRASWLVEKATETGVGAIRFLATERSPRRFGSGTLERLARIARSAVEQSGRSRVPEISGVHDWDELPDRLAALHAVWFLDLDAAAAPPAMGAAGKVALLVGPEGGWSEPERRKLTDLGCRPLGLGPRTLRLETAAVLGSFWLIVSSSVDTSKDPSVLLSRR